MYGSFTVLHPGVKANEILHEEVFTEEFNLRIEIRVSTVT